ncbi:MAG: alpha-galactosidase [Glaciecola sp.]|jgi:alpha-galactosidase
MTQDHHASGFKPVAEIPALTGSATVYEDGWQSWSPAGIRPIEATSPRPAREIWQTMAYRPETPAPAAGHQGEGLVAIRREPDGPVDLFAAPDPTRAVPSIRVAHLGDRALVSANGPVEHLRLEGSWHHVLTTWASMLANRLDVPSPAPVTPGWCSWYCYWNKVTEQNIVDELQAMQDLELPVQTVQIDDGWQAEIGDWTTTSSRFNDMAALAERIKQSGRRAGIWTAPFLVGAKSKIAHEHPEWLVKGAIACEQQWDQRVGVLDVTHPGAAEHLREVFATLSNWGYRYFKIDFLYAAAMVGGRHQDTDPIAAYRTGLQLIRDAIGPDAVLLGCGAPLLASIGMVDAMRVSPDVDPSTEPADGDLSQPALRSALYSGRARAYQHDRWWVNDPDCLVLRPEVEHREAWADHCAALGGLAVSSDPLRSLDPRGLELTRALLQTSRKQGGVWDPEALNPRGGVDLLTEAQGRLLPHGS